MLLAAVKVLYCGVSSGPPSPLLPSIASYCFVIFALCWTSLCTCPSACSYWVAFSAAYGVRSWTLIVLKCLCRRVQCAFLSHVGVSGFLPFITGLMFACVYIM